MSVLPPDRPRPRHRAPSTSERTRSRIAALVPTARGSLPVKAGRPALATLAVLGIVAGGTAGSAVLTPSGAAPASSASGSSPTRSDASPGAGAVTAPLSVRAEASLLEQRTAASAEVSRGAARSDLHEVVLLDRQGAEVGVPGTARVAAPSDPRDLAAAMLGDYGWTSSEFSCLDALWVGESNWDHTATNPTSGAYGIPQSLPAEKMATAGADWRTNPATQIEWGLGYIRATYGSPCAANSFKLSNGWY